MAILNNSNAISSGGYDINNSLRFRQSASTYLNRTPASTTNQKTFTWSGWVKRGALSSDYRTLYMGGNTQTDTTFSINFSPSNEIEIRGYNTIWVLTTQVFRDPSAWYHIVVAVDTTQATAANRIILYVNGVQVTARTYTAPTQNTNFLVNTNVAQAIGYQSAVWGFSYFDGYMAEVNWIDGQALTPSSFGETDTTTGVWKPKAYTGTYGTNGFYLKFSDIATTSGSNAGLGKDFSGNTNYWTTNNISVTAGTTYDAMIDSPTLTSATVANYAVLNPLDKNATGVTISSANLKNTTSSLNVGVRGTIAVSSGKWYWETTITTATNTPQVGIATINWVLDYVGSSNGVGYLANAVKYVNGVGTSYGATFTTGDIIGVALDMDSGSITFYKNNVSQGSAATGLSGEYFPAVAGQASDVTDTNFGQRPFAYTPPTGFVALNTYNLPDSTIKKGSTVMDATTYTGTGASLSVTNTGAFKPDFVWVKGRSGATDHALYDSVRGTTIDLVSNSTAAETTQAQGLTAFGTNGFTVGTLAKMNTNAATYVGWQWQAGQGSTSSNTSGSITSTVSVNTTAGFSIATYTGNGTAGATIGHGLGVAPAMVIAKQRSSSGQDWIIYNKNLPSASYTLSLNSTAAQDSTNFTTWNGTAPSSTLITLGSSARANGSGVTYVIYAWAEIAGFSKFGSYTGNGSADSPFLYLGFRPKFILFKRAVGGVGNWLIYDSSRDTYNQMGNILYPNLSSAEYVDSNKVDFLSNGVKIRSSQTDLNTNGDTYIYAAFAENPFKNSNAR